MNWMLVLIVLVVVGISLKQNYALDLGQHRKAKIIHALLSSLFFYTYVDSISFLIGLVQYFEMIRNSAQGFGIITQDTHFILLLLSNLLGVVALWYFGKMIKRDNHARKVIIKLLPILGLISSIGFYRGFLEDGDSMGLSDGLIISLGLVIMLGFYIGFMMIYKSPMMVRFFKMELEDGEQSEENLGKLINEIGEGMNIEEK
ncbi:MAG: hypothetical protein AAF696_29885 [Bacteroidota bacterium]